MRKCPRCHNEMTEDCYIVDSPQPLSDLIIIEKDETFKKTKYPLKAAICKDCGYVEFYTDIKK